MARVTEEFVAVRKRSVEREEQLAEWAAQVREREREKEGERERGGTVVWSKQE